MSILEPMYKSKICVAYEYEFRRGTNASQTTRNINEVFGDNVANERTVRRCFERFRSNRLPFFPSIRQLFTRKNLCIRRTGKTSFSDFIASCSPQFFVAGINKMAEMYKCLGCIF